MKIGNIPVQDKDRDAAWAAFIKRKDVQEFFEGKDDAFRFPLERGWYEVWCQCWEKAWDAGFTAGRVCRAKHQKDLRKQTDNKGGLVK